MWELTVWSWFQQFFIVGLRALTVDIQLKRGIFNLFTSIKMVGRSQRKTSIFLRQLKLWFLIPTRELWPLMWPTWWSISVILIPWLLIIEFAPSMSYTIVHDLIRAIFQWTWSHYIWIACIRIIIGWLLYRWHDTTVVKSLHHLGHVILQVLQGWALIDHHMVFRDWRLLVLLVWEIKHFLIIYINKHLP